MRTVGVTIILMSFFLHQVGFADEALDAFIEYQESARANDNLDSDAIDDFYKRSFAFWMQNKVDYNANADKYAHAMALYHQNRDRYQRDRSIALDRFESTIDQFRRFDARNQLPDDPILFVGSSSIVFWETAESFPDYPVINRGFGGASLPEVMHYYDDVIGKHAPSIIVVYCDIDVENGKSPEFSANAFKGLVTRVGQDYPETKIVFLSMKPTLIDDMLGKDVRANKLRTNEILAAYSEENENLHYVDISSVMFADATRLKHEIFLNDGMHLNDAGYVLWNPIVREKLEQLRNELR